MEYYGNYSSDNYLKHYGVLGMKWGVTHALSKWNRATTTEQKKSAVKSLQKHHDKINKKMTQLSNESTELSKAKFRYETKTKPKIAKYQEKSFKLNNKAYKLGLNQVEKAKKLEAKARKYDIKASKLETKAASMNSKIIKINAKRMIYSQNLAKVDAVLLGTGKKYVEDALKKKA